jgi:ATP-dependent helicase HrpB
LCLRLWSSEEHSHRPAHELPEVKRLDLAEVALTLKAAGVADLRAFRWLEPPEERALARAEELLVDLGATRERAEGRDLKAEGSRKSQGTIASEIRQAVSSIGQSGSCITSLGRKMLAFPLHPRYARMLLAAQEHGCVYEACLVAALTQGRDLLLRNADAAVVRAREEVIGDKISSDFHALMRLWQQAARDNYRPETCRRLGLHLQTARQVGPLLEQFLDIARREGLDVSRRDAPEDALRKCILNGFSDRVARRLDSSMLQCELVHGRRGTLSRDSVVQSSAFLVAAEIQEVDGREKSVNTRLSLLTAIEEAWIEEMFPDAIETTRRVFYDAASRRVYASEQMVFRGLVIGDRRIEPPPLEAAGKLLADEVIAGRLALNGWDEAVEQWILRLNLLGQWCAELSVPPITESDRRHLVEEICYGTFSYRDIKDKPVATIVKGWLSPAQQELVEKHAPERLRLSNGRSAKVLYEPGKSPRIALRIQELYGVTDTLRIAMKRVPVVVEILAPSRRPVQITQDLERFWREHYPRLKQELQRRYPKHEWR